MVGILALQSITSSSTAALITPTKVGFQSLCQGVSSGRFVTSRQGFEPHLNPARGSIGFGAAGSHQGRRSSSFVPGAIVSRGFQVASPLALSCRRQSDGSVVPRRFSAARPLPAAIAIPGDKSRRDQCPERIVPRRFSSGCGKPTLFLIVFLVWRRAPVVPR
jgi:hypothetical protein